MPCWPISYCHGEQFISKNSAGPANPREHRNRKELDHSTSLALTDPLGMERVVLSPLHLPLCIWASYGEPAHKIVSGSLGLPVTCPVLPLHLQNLYRRKFSAVSGLIELPNQARPTVQHLMVNHTGTGIISTNWILMPAFLATPSLFQHE